MKSQILLTISILISNRPDTVRKCLDSIKPLLGNVPSELILVDTGCGEQVRGIIEEYSDHIIDFEWCRDFAKARNAGLKEAKGKWFLFLDDDEWFEDTAEIIDFFNSGEYKNYGFGVYVQRNYLDRDGSVYSDLLVGRMSRLEPDVKFVYSIHECFNRVRGKTKKFQAYVHHYGYAYRTEKDAREHSLRNISLLLKEHEAEPGVVKHTLQLAQEYNAIGEYSKSLEMSVEGISLYRQGIIDNMYFLSSLFANEINCYMELYRYDEAIEKGEEYLTAKESDKMVKAMIAGDLAAAYVEKGEWKKALKNAGIYWDIYLDYLKDDEAFLGFETTITNKCFEQRNRSIVLGNGIRAAVMLSEAETAWRWFESFDWKEPRMFINNEMIRAVAERMPEAEATERAFYVKMCNILLERGELEDYVVQTISDCCRSRETLAEKAAALSAYEGVESEHWFFKMRRIVVDAFGERKETTEATETAEKLTYMSENGCDVEAFAAAVWEEPERSMPLIRAYSMWEAVERLGGDNRKVLESIPFYLWKKGIAKYFEQFSWEDADWWNDKLTAALPSDEVHMLIWRALYGLAGAVKAAAKQGKDPAGAEGEGVTAGKAGNTPQGEGRKRAEGQEGGAESEAGGIPREITAGLAIYADCQKALCERMYRADVIEQAKDMLPEEYQGGYLIGELIGQIGAEKYGEAVAAIKEIRKLLPGLTNVLKPYLHWIDGELKRREQESKQAAGEFQVLARQIKRKIRGFMEAGEYQAALDVAKQIQPLLPEDRELRGIMEELTKLSGIS